MRRAAIAPALVALALGACSSGPQPYEDVGGLAAALRDGGLECSNLQQGGGSDLVEESGSCSNDGAPLSLFVFEGMELRDRWLVVGREFGSEVVGPNWVVIARDEAGAADVAEATGGEVGVDE